MAGDLASTSARTSATAVAARDPMVTGATVVAGEGGCYGRVAEAIAHLLVQLRVVGGGCGGRRRGRSGGNLRVLSDGRPGEV